MDPDGCCTCQLPCSRRLAQGLKLNPCWEPVGNLAQLEGTRTSPSNCDFMTAPYRGQGRARGLLGLKRGVTLDLTCKACFQPSVSTKLLTPGLLRQPMLLSKRSGPRRLGQSLSHVLSALATRALGAFSCSRASER